MKAFFKKLHFYILTFLFFFGLKKKTINKPIIPSASSTPREWTEDETIIAMYLMRFDTDYVGVKLEFVAETIGRSYAALIRKIYRLESLNQVTVIHNRTASLSQKVHLWFKYLDEFKARVKFYNALIRVGMNRTPSNIQYFQRRLQNDLSQL